MQTYFKKLKKNDRELPADLLAQNLIINKIELIGGSIENIDALADFPELEYLSLVNVPLKEISAKIFELPHLHTLRVKGGKLISLPQVAAPTKSISSLQLMSNGITELPAWVGSLSRLEYLDLSNNQISDLPLAFGNIPALKRLILDNNQIGSIPIAMTRLKTLSHLSIEGNPLSASDKAVISEIFGIWF